MAEAAYATGPALLGAPRLLSSIFFLNFLFPVSARGPNSAPVRGPKEPKVLRKRYSPQNLKIEAPKCGAPNDFFVPCFSARSKQLGAPKSPRPPKAKPQTKKTSRPQSLKSEAPKAGPQTKFFVPSLSKGLQKAIARPENNRVQKISKFAANC